VTKQVRILTSGSEGAEVSELQGSLLSLDLSIDAEELSSAVFGSTIRRGVLEFQPKHKLAATGTVDDGKTKGKGVFIHSSASASRGDSVERRYA
jgi:hypothetical protein